LLCTACHLALLQNRALRTNATTQQVLQVAVEDCGYQHRSTGVPQVLLQHHKVEDEQQQQQQQRQELEVVQLAAQGMVMLTVPAAA
jgi:RNase P subunit RPR2